MLAFFCLGARYRPWRYFAALHSRVFGDGAAPRRTRCSPQPRQHSVFRASGGGVLQVLPSVPFFLRGGRQLFGAGRIQAFVHGKIFTNAFSGDWHRFVNARQSPFYAIISLWLRKNRHPSGKTQALPIQWVGCSRGHVPYRTINKEKRLRWQLLHIALSARKRRKW